MFKFNICNRISAEALDLELQKTKKQLEFMQRIIKKNAHTDAGLLSLLADPAIKGLVEGEKMYLRCMACHLYQTWSLWDIHCSKDKGAKMIKEIRDGFINGVRR